MQAAAVIASAAKQSTPPLLVRSAFDLGTVDGFAALAIDGSFSGPTPPLTLSTDAD
jgi:hypothetical protein